MANTIRIAPSLFAADPMHLEDELRRVIAAGADLIHFDVMDGHFVENLGGGMHILRAAAKLDVPLDVHLMVDAPEKYIDTAAEAGAEIITVHLEASSHVHRLLQRIRESGAQAGVALNPATPAQRLEYLLGEFDLALVMACNPGALGQSLIPSMAQKAGEIRRMLEAHGCEAEIEVDGGINLVNAAPFIGQGARTLVVGRALFGADDPADFIRRMRELEE